jgi:multidrug efflux pump subunit AcrA (membrane-fusion protein)
MGAAVELARARLTTAEDSVQTAKDAARRAKKRLRRAKEELAEARSAFAGAEEKLARRARRATSQGKRVVPITASKPSVSKCLTKAKHRTKTQDGDLPVAATLPAVRPLSPISAEALPNMIMATESSFAIQNDPTDQA